MRVRGRYRNQTVELATPLALAEGTEVEVEIVSPPMDSEAWHELGMSRREEEWNNPQDAIYDNWRELYGRPSG